jgi:hypothetical protein
MPLNVQGFMFYRGEKHYKLQSYSLKPFCNALQLSLFNLEIVALCNGIQCNGGSPISVTKSVTHKNCVY